MADVVPSMSVNGWLKLSLRARYQFTGQNAPCTYYGIRYNLKRAYMNTLFLGIVIFLIVLAVFDLVVGVSNDAVNF